MQTERPPLVLAVSGASAQPLAVRALQWLLDAGDSIDLVTSRGAVTLWQAEMGISVPAEPQAQEAFWREQTGSIGGQLRCHRWSDQASSIASGSYRTRGMVILPASMGCVGRIAAGVATDLLERCADVHLKEARPLVICPREMPWNLVHLRNLCGLAEAGARIAPPVPAWYHQPKSIGDMVDFLVVRIFDVLGEDIGPLNRWSGRG
jgi:4-hydroxy-3-polyprenylbenzoate decarboxylase